MYRFRDQRTCISVTTHACMDGDNKSSNRSSLSPKQSRSRQSPSPPLSIVSKIGQRLSKAKKKTRPPVLHHTKTIPFTCWTQQKGGEGAGGVENTDGKLYRIAWYCMNEASGLVPCIPATVYSIPHPSNSNVRNKHTQAHRHTHTHTDNLTSTKPRF